MSQDRERTPADLSALRIRREPEKARGAPRVAAPRRGPRRRGGGRRVLPDAGRSLRGKTVETVTASIVTEGQATTLLSATGYVEAERKADLSPKITSRITELNVTEGTRVRKGDVIARLDHTDLDAQLADAQGRLGQREGGARAAEGAPRPRASRRSRRSTPRSRQEASTRAAVRYVRGAARLHR